VGCLALALTYAFKDFCQLTLCFFAQECTLITSLSEFISVFKQPTSSVVFRPTIHPCRLRITQSQLWVALLWYISASSVC